MATSITLRNADVTTPEGVLRGRFRVDDDEAYVLDPRGRRVWQAKITGWRQTVAGKRATYEVDLVDGPTVVAVRNCGCGARR